ncbi:MAG TPA: thiamine phosphate synthase [Chthonomonadales bacterium]|nr:thiamine phosphate synthase [Chthonomonadales bacterium]
MWELYLVTDRELSLGRPLEDVVAGAVRGGVAIVQLREKQASTRCLIEEAERIRRLLVGSHVPLIINDRVDVALAVGADGVHLGQEDMPYAMARALLGPQAIIGLSVETVEQVLEAEHWDVDYLGVSPVFETPTKPDTRGSWGLEGLALARRISRHRLVAIGGLHAANAESVVRAGADSVAVVSAICSAPEPERAAAELDRIIRSALSARGGEP